MRAYDGRQRAPSARPLRRKGAAMDGQHSVVVFGSMNMDLSVACERIPEAGETIAGSDFFTAAGGKGANQAVAAARRGAATYMIAAVGDDGFGRELTAGLEDAGVDCANVAHLADVPTGTATILRSGGDNRIVLSAGANAVRTPEDVEGVIDKLVASGAAPMGSVFIAQGECDLGATAAALVRAHRHGLFTIFNPAPACNLPEEAWREVDLVCLNETECAAITGIMPVDEASCTAALKKMEELTDGGMGVITLGSAGSVALIDDDFMHVPAQRCEAVDTTGAGDTYIGVFAAARAAGELIFECMIQASFASGLAVTRLGAQPSIPTWDEVVAWMMGW